VTLRVEEFLCRFLLHVLPKGFVKIRHYGLLAPRHAGAKLAAARQALGNPETAKPMTPTVPSSAPRIDHGEARPVFDSTRYPACARGFLVRLPLPHQRPPPAPRPS
jgi:hypothetical protein